MPGPTALLRQLFDRNRAGEAVGIYSICSAHPEVIAAACELAHERSQIAVVEATCNQVNQDGGYTGMKPADFVRLAKNAAIAAGLDPQLLVLGGDHLGPQPWRRLPAEVAMAKAEAMVDAYVRAGFSKIHLDCSMQCADDPEPLGDDVTATRAARLAGVAEAAARDVGSQPIYIVGTEVPPPGGMGEGHAIKPTTPASVRETWSAHAQAFSQKALDDAFGRVRAIVVQPGLDFGNDQIVHYQSHGAEPLGRSVLEFEGAVFEAHSTDYQKPEAYKALVKGHFAILKVGPAATFALREAIYALDLIARELGYAGPKVRQALENAMLASPANWESHYGGDPDQQAYLRHFSFSDRLRYYWSVPDVRQTVERLFAHLADRSVPLPLLSQYLPQLVSQVHQGRIIASPSSLVRAAVKHALFPYADACGVHFR